MRPQKGSDEEQRRVSLKVKHLIDAREYPNTPTGRKQAVAVAYNMSRSGRLTKTGSYRRVKK